MRGLALILILAGCSGPLPEGMSRFELDAETTGISVDLAGRRVDYFVGGYPRKTYHCSRGLDAGPETCERVKAPEPTPPPDEGWKLYAALLPQDAPVETVALAGRTLYAVALSTRAAADGRAWMRPRDLYSVDTIFPTKGGKIAWTARPGEFLGYDAKTGSLLFAVVDRDAPDLWKIRADEKTLSAAGAVIDRPGSAAGSWKRVFISLGAIVASSMLIAAIFAGRR